MHLDKQHPKPVYLQLKEMLQSQIEQGVYLVHQKLPSERDLCQSYNLSRMTARRALKALIAEGYAYTKVGKGTFVKYAPSLMSTTVARKVEQAQPREGDDALLNLEAQQKLMTVVASFDGASLEKTVSEFLAIYSLETVVARIFPELIRYSEHQWMNGKLGLIVHNYIITTLRSQLIGMMNAAGMSGTGSQVVLACAPEDQHEIGLIALAITLRRRGYLVIYLGPNVAVDEFGEIVEYAKPQLICMSAATDQAVENVHDLCQKCKGLFSLAAHEAGKHSRPVFSYGGVIFTHESALVSDTPGVYLGDTIEAAAEKINQLVSISSSAAS